MNQPNIDLEVNATTRETIASFGERFRAARRWWLITFPIALALAFLGMIIGVALRIAYGHVGTAVTLVIWTVAALTNWSAWWRVCSLRCPHCGKRFCHSVSNNGDPAAWRHVCIVDSMYKRLSRGGHL